MSDSNCCFLTCIQISQETGKVVWYSRLLKNFPQFVVIHTVKGFSGVPEADVFSWNSLAFLMIQRILAEAFSKSSLNWKILCPCTVEAWLGEFWALLCYCVRWAQLCSSVNILWHCLSLGSEWKLTFSSPVATAEFSKFAGILSAALSQHHRLGFEIAQLEFQHFH